MQSYGIKQRKKSTIQRKKYVTHTCIFNEKERYRFVKQILYKLYLQTHRHTGSSPSFADPEVFTSTLISCYPCASSELIDAPSFRRSRRSTRNTSRRIHKKGCRLAPRIRYIVKLEHLIIFFLGHRLILLNSKQGNYRTKKKYC